jgi:hypothetical protein
VLTSDDCDFRTVGIPVTDDFGDAISAELTGFLNGRGETPKLLLCYMPLINKIGGDMMIDGIDGVTGGKVPLFGTMAIDHNIDFGTAMTIHNGAAFRGSIVLGAVYGEPEFDFATASLDESKIRKQKAVITAADKTLLISVNGKPVMEYLEEIGMTREGFEKGVVVVPLVIEHEAQGMKPFARAVITFTPEGYAVCGGMVPVGATIAIGRIDRADVMNTAERTLRPFIAGGGTLLTYSCMSRHLVLGADWDAEARKIRDVAVNNVYQYACSGGEICPVEDGEGGFKNVFHNFSVVFCKIG